MKKLLSLNLILILILAACGGTGSESEEKEDGGEQEVAQVVESSKEEKEAAKEEAPTATSPPATATQPPAAEKAEPTPTQAAEVAQSEQSAPTGPASCRVDPLNFDVNLAIPQANEDDWQHGGGLEARINVIEYGDFQ